MGYIGQAIDKLRAGQGDLSIDHLYEVYLSVGKFVIKVIDNLIWISVYIVAYDYATPWL